MDSWQPKTIKAVLRMVAPNRQAVLSQSTPQTSASTTVNNMLFTTTVFSSVAAPRLKPLLSVCPTVISSVPESAESDY